MARLLLMLIPVGVAWLMITQVFIPWVFNAKTFPAFRSDSFVGFLKAALGVRI